MRIGLRSTVLAAALAATPMSSGLSAQEVSGRVFDANSGMVLAGASVSIHLPETLLDAQLVATLDGSFSFVVEEPGPYRLTIDAFGYEPRSVDLLVLEEGFTGIEIGLTPRVIELEGLTATVRRTVSSLQRAGFYRRQASGIGRAFLDSAQIADIPAMLPRQVMRGVPGLTVRGFEDIRLDGWCKPAIYVDGAPLGAVWEELPHPRYMLGIELYRGTEYIPPRWRPRSMPCGVLLIWTRLT